MAVAVYGCVLRYIDDPSECDQDDVDSIKSHLIEHVPDLDGYEVDEVGLCMRPPRHPREVCDGTSEDTLLLVVHYQDGTRGSGVGVDPDGSVFYTEPFDPRNLQPSSRTRLRCDGCGYEFTRNDILYTNHDDVDLCEVCYARYTRPLDRMSAP